MGTPLSHVDIGWDGFTRAAVEALNKLDGVVFMLWGAHAKKYAQMLTTGAGAGRKSVLTCAHPSPLSASNGFFGCGHFKKANEFLKSIGKAEIAW
jgi:uracil-DNA glycosylase